MYRPNIVTKTWRFLIGHRKLLKLSARYHRYRLAKHRRRRWINLN